MNDLYYRDDRAPTQSELELISELSTDQITDIDTAILSVTSTEFKKVAYIVAMVKTDQPRQIGVRLPDSFFTARVAHLVSNGKLEARGDLKKMRFSEVKQPDYTRE